MSARTKRSKKDDKEQENTMASSSSTTPTVVVLITGATSGIGLSMAKQLAKRPNHLVLGTCRSLEKGKGVIEAAGCKAVELDVSSDESCESLPKRLAQAAPGINKVEDIQLTHFESILINNAGILKADKLDSPTLIKDTLDQINTNAIGPLRVTLALLPFLKKAVAESPDHRAKVANVSSRMGSIGDNPSGGYYGYRASKSAENMISVNLANDLAKDNILSIVLHPGYIRTKMTGNHGDMDPDECASRLLKVIDGATKEDCNRFIHRDGQTIPW